MKKSELKANYYIFGNKGNVWSNKCHIAHHNYSGTLCGIPMLSSNHARNEGVTEIGCPDCIAIYKEKEGQS